MLSVYIRGEDGRITAATEPRAALASGAFVWADFFAPTDNAQTREEEALIERALGIDAPTPAERAAMEDSARFYEENGALYLTATLMGQREEGAFVADPVTFILANQRLVTVRAIKPRAFLIGQSRATANVESAIDAPGVLTALLEAIVERIADILQETNKTANTLSGDIFVGETAANSKALREIGRIGTMASLCHDSLSSLKRLATFVQSVCVRYGLPADRFIAFSQDVQELERSAEALQNHVSFLLDAALGLVAATQNNTLKALSLATIAFVPPTLIASIFGMNFETLAWIHEPWGPWAAMAMMITAPLALLAIAKWRKWF